MIRIGEIKEILENATESELQSRINEFRFDERAGVQKLLDSYEKKLEELKEEEARIEAMKEYERKFASYEYICGVDEVGRGPFAGPVMACAVILPKDCSILYINDSKQVSEKKREELCEIIKREAVSYAVASVSNEEIDEIGIKKATLKAMRTAVSRLNPQPDMILVDAEHIPGIDIEQCSIIKGDAKSISIGAASIVAKVTRDHLMQEYAKLYPEYQFDKNKGYGGSKAHQDALRKLGPCPIHRKDFIKKVCSRRVAAYE